MRARISTIVVAPFQMPNDSHARLAGKSDACAKTPPPTMKLRGLWSLNRNSSPGASALNRWLPPGCQKLTSSSAGWLASSSYQSPSVTPTKRSMDRGDLPIARECSAVADGKLVECRGGGAGEALAVSSLRPAPDASGGLDADELGSA